MNGNVEEKLFRPIWLWGALLFSFIAWLTLVLPDHPDALTLFGFARLPLEWPLLCLVVLLVPRRLRKLVIFLCGILVLLVLLLKLADLGVQSAFQRQFNPYLDIKMMRDGWNLISGTIGTPGALAALLFAAVAIFLVLAIFLKSAKWMCASEDAARRALIASFSIIALAACITPLANRKAFDFHLPQYLAARLSLVVKSVEDTHAFEAELSAGVGLQDGTGLFKAVAGKDVVIVFVESYGRSAVENPRYADVTVPRLKSIEMEIAKAGLKSVSAWTTSPTVGGLSWLAHGTFMSGLWVNSQARYDRLMISQHPTLNRLFRQAGWESVAVMPAITMAWPEADYFGYEQVFAASNLQYRGKPFNWVTMPDQYTLSAFQRLAVAPARSRGHNVIAEIALISSHAPWTPVPRLVDWNSVGDGSIFDEQAVSGDPPSVVWADAERVRSQYIQTVDYSLATLGQYMAQHGENAVFVILGDHQPASIITGPDASRAVPVHVVTDDESLVSRFREHGFDDGLIPAPSGKEFPMSDLRKILIDSFSLQR